MATRLRQSGRVEWELTPPEEGNDVASSAPAAASGEHQLLVGLEEDLGGALHRTVDAEFLRVFAVELTEQVNNASPDVGRNPFDVSQAALFDRAQQLIGLAQLVARGGGGATLPGPEAMLCDFQNGALDHDLSSHDNPGMEERVESQEVYDSRLFKVYRDEVRLPNGHLTTREIVRHPGSVAIIPRHADGRIVLVRQYPYVTGRELWEIPAGTLDKTGEDTPTAARREVAEEGGVQGGGWGP